MMEPRFKIDPDPAVAGGPVTVTYMGSGESVEWSVDGGGTTSVKVPPDTFVIDPLPNGDTLFLTEPKEKVGSVKAFPIDQPRVDHR
jgi:hypothetical protein